MSNDDQNITKTNDDQPQTPTPMVETGPRPRWYVVHTYSGHENKVATALKQRVESEHLEKKILEGKLMSGIRELNPCLQLGKLTLSHSTNPAKIKIKS